mgnify:CR=1 FL=1|jgi:hypothetical protein|tara:strand:+ start:821 stop:1591 length:771 start_codon:yes stop_codon:yes gene_type:complete
MAYPKITVNTGLALQIISSDTILIPSPDLTTISGTATGVASGTANVNTAFALEDTTATFLAATPPLPVVVGDLVIQVALGAGTAAIAPITGTVVTLGADIFPLGTEAYAIVKTNHLIVSGETFVTKGVSVGDVVYNTTANTTATVTAINNEVDLTLSADLFGGSATFNDNYKIFLAGSPLGQRVINSAEGCLLYVGSKETTMTIEKSYVDVKVKTTAGSDVIFTNFPVGEYLPIQVLQLFSTGTDAEAQSNCIAIW